MIAIQICLATLLGQHLLEEVSVLNEPLWCLSSHFIVQEILMLDLYTRETVGVIVDVS